MRCTAARVLDTVTGGTGAALELSALSRKMFSTLFITDKCIFHIKPFDFFSVNFASKIVLFLELP